MDEKDQAQLWKDKAYTRLADAEMLYKLDSLESAVNRLYYAALAAVTAALTIRQVTPESHKAAKRLLGLHFVKTGRLSADDARLFGELQEMRDAADYDGLVTVTKEELADYTARTRAFVDAVTALLKDAD